ncbi:helix-turn-helix transcriptional regulator [Methylophaga sp.]|uniref:helix-turn-helix transcriptional regulator n=1 Tax=Methylophaga sp. TaxID=2024840 RepID=UPI003A9502F3
MTDRVLNMHQILEITNKSRATIYSWMKKGYFPKQRQFGPNSIGWWESDIKKWAEEINQVH